MRSLKLRNLVAEIVAGAHNVFCVSARFIPLVIRECCLCDDRSYFRLLGLIRQFDELFLDHSELGSQPLQTIVDIEQSALDPSPRVNE